MTATSAQASSARDTVDAVVVGAGFAGMYAIYKLRELGLSHRGFDSNTKSRQHRYRLRSR